jgi:hypothetical protein
LQNLFNRRGRGGGGARRHQTPVHHYHRKKPKGDSEVFYFRLSDRARASGV